MAYDLFTEVNFSFFQTLAKRIHTREEENHKGRLYLFEVLIQVTVRKRYEFAILLTLEFLLLFAFYRSPQSGLLYWRRFVVHSKSILDLVVKFPEFLFLKITRVV